MAKIGKVWRVPASKFGEQVDELPQPNVDDAVVLSDETPF